jgi:hypothetical protein
MGVSEPIPLMRGLKQGGVESLFLFNLMMSHIIREAQNKFGNECMLSYADDIVIFASSETGLQDITNFVSSALQRIGLRIAGKKSEVVTPKGAEEVQLMVNGIRVQSKNLEDTEFG